MAVNKENIKSLFSNSRTRIIIIFTLILLLVTVIIGFMKLYSATNPLNEKSGVVRGAAGIKSIPGALNQTAQYAALQETQNIEQAKEAAKKGGSAIPTIIRSQAFGDGVESVGAQGGEGSVGFATLARENLEGPQSTLWYQNLKDQHCSPQSLAKAIEAGASLTDLKKVCTCEQLKRRGYSLSELKPICPCPELKNLGFSPKQFKDAGYCAAELKVCGFTACEERGAGFSADEMKNAGYSDGELSGAGFSARDIARAGGLPDGVTSEDVQKAGCDVEQLRRLRGQGVSAAAIQVRNGCSAAALKAAGYSALELKNAGFSAAELKAAGFSPEELRQAGYRARELMDAGFSAADLAAAGFSPADIGAAEMILPAGISPSDVKNAGCSEEAIKRERLAGVSAAMIKKIAGCSASALAAGGFSVKDLERAGFKPEELTTEALALGDNSGVSNEDVKNAGCDPHQLQILHDKGVSAKRIREISGCTADALRKAGYDLRALATAGFNRAQLLAAGFKPEELTDAIMALGNQVDTSGLSDDTVKSAGCDPAKLKAMHDQGVSAQRIHKLSGCSAQALKNAGYDLNALAGAGFTPAQLLAAGFSPKDLQAAGMALTPAGIIAAGRAGCSKDALAAAHSAGMSARTIKQTLGCDAAALKAAGYSAAELKEAGFSAAALKNAGFSATELKNAGFSAKDLRSAGFSSAALKAAGYDAAALKDAGFSAAELKAAGFSASDLKAAGFSAQELKAAGFSNTELKAAGYTATELKAAGATAAELKAAGYSSDELQAAGFSQRDSALAGLADLGTKTNPIIPAIAGGVPANRSAQIQAANAQKLERILAQQKSQMADQKYQQKVQQRTAAMVGAANQFLQAWKVAPQQAYTSGNPAAGAAADGKGGPAGGQVAGDESQSGKHEPQENKNGTLIVIKTGDVVFGVIDTSVNSDEPGPILATIVSGPLKGSKLIGSFNLPADADKMVISFNSMSTPGAPKTVSVSAFAIDPDTARTALSSETNHHYMSRYAALFSSTFLEGFGNAFQSADTTITIGGTGDTQQTTVQNGIGRSTLENAVIGLATVGKAWGQQAQKGMNRKPTVEVYSGTGIGVLFTQDVKIIM